MNLVRITPTLAAAAGGLLAAAVLPTAIAFADTDDLVPDPTTFSPESVEGFPPLFTEVTGSEFWSSFDATTGQVVTPDLAKGEDTLTTLGSFTNDDFLVTNSPFNILNGIQVDLANFGGGFENEWIDIPGNLPNSGVSDLLITPFGDFTLLGTFPF